MGHLPALGALDKAKERVAGKMNDRDLRFLTNASDELFRAFTAGLCDYVQTPGRELPVVLLFDTFERAWAGQIEALDALIHACLRAELPVLFVIAGRDGPDSLRPDDRRWWQKAGVMDPYPLGNLLEATEFLGKKGVTEPELVRRILELTHGFPMFLRMACEVVELTSGTQAEIAKDFPEGRIQEEQVTQYLLGRILNRLPEGKNDLKAAVRLLGLARWFDKPILALLMDKKALEVADDWDILTHTSLVRRSGRPECWEFYDPIRESILSEWKSAGGGSLEHHRKLAKYHSGHEKDFARVRERLYHRVAFEPAETITEWKALCKACMSSMRIGDYEALLGDSFQYMIRWDEMDGGEAAHIHFDMGYALGEYPTKRAALVEERIRHYEEALEFYTGEETGKLWAMAQNNLGSAYIDLPTGDRGDNLGKAIECYEAALRVYTEKGFPQQWATTQNNLGAAYAQLPTGDRNENLKRAIRHFEAALRVYTEKDFPQDWAMTQNNLGNPYLRLPTGDKGENLKRAMRHFEAALRVRTEKDFPQQWAMTQFNIGLAHLHSARLIGSVDMLRQARECFLDSASGFSSVGCPGEAERARSNADRIEKWLRQAPEETPSE